MNKTDETTRQIIEYLQRSQHYARRHNQIRVPGRGFPKKDKGVGDIVAYLRPNGRALEIEVKTGKDRISPEQYVQGMKLRRVGAWYLVVHDFEDFLKQFENIQKMSS